VTLTATFAVHKDGTFPYIWYWDEASQTMQVGAWGDALDATNYASTMLFFKFGGVVGFTNNGENGDAFDISSIIFNPSLTEITGYGSSGNASALPDVPSFTVTDYDNGIRDVSSDTYHTLANVKAGKGDPCKLVGLTVAQIQAGVYDSGLYRLPTNAENQTFFGSSSDSNSETYDPTYTTWTANQANAADPGTRTFHKSDPANAVLPATGSRNTFGGTVDTRGTIGYWWTSTPQSSTGGYDLVFTGTYIHPSSSYFYGSGFAVRCVPQ
jgi:hypothetical protein